MKLIKIDELANILAISENTARKWAKTNPQKLPPRFRIPNSPKLIRYNMDDINNWLLNSSKDGYLEKNTTVSRGRKRGNNS